jgi:hypothetical protein
VSGRDELPFSPEQHHRLVELEFLPLLQGGLLGMNMEQGGRQEQGGGQDKKENERESLLFHGTPPEQIYAGEREPTEKDFRAFLPVGLKLGEKPGGVKHLFRMTDQPSVGIASDRIFSMEYI